MFFQPDPRLRGAACRDISEREKQMFFSGKACREAKKICHTCPIIDGCLEVILEFESAPGSVRHGVWGGMTAAERNREYGLPPVWVMETPVVPVEEDDLHRYDPLSA